MLAADTTAAGPAREWLADRYCLPFEVITDVLCRGHSAHRMHGLPRRSGAEVKDRLLAAVEAASIPVLAEANATVLFAADGAASGLSGPTAAGYFLGTDCSRRSRSGASPVSQRGVMRP